MTNKSNVIGLGNLNPEKFDPLVIGGERHGVVHFIRDDQSNGRVNRAAIWKLEADQLPYESPYPFMNDETFLVLEGELEMTFQDGSQLTLRQGDIISVAAGTHTNWRITKPFKKFVVEVGV